MEGLLVADGEDALTTLYLGVGTYDVYGVTFFSDLLTGDDAKTLPHFLPQAPEQQ